MEDTLDDVTFWKTAKRVLVPSVTGRKGSSRYSVRLGWGRRASLATTEVS